MTSSLIPTLENHYSAMHSQPMEQSPYCTIIWRQGKLLVKSPGQQKQPYLPSLDTPKLLEECLKKSSVDLVVIDPKLGESKLNFWANACEQARKPIYLSIPSVDKRAQKNIDNWKWLKYSLEWVIALIVLIVATPIMLGISLLMYIYQPGSLFNYEWHIGNRGRLFRLIKFRTVPEGQDQQSVSVLGRWMRKYGLDNLPQLLNVLRGEMNITGRCSCSLKDLTRLNLEGQRHLNQVPGIASLWKLKAEAMLLPNLDSQAL
jgi:lipopolysaccharide/colanic/teichoic acid biosynthesis glycosyltransferase